MGTAPYFPSKNRVLSPIFHFVPDDVDKWSESQTRMSVLPLPEYVLKGGRHIVSVSSPEPSAFRLTPFNLNISQFIAYI